MQPRGDTSVAQVLVAKEVSLAPVIPDSTDLFESFAELILASEEGRFTWKGLGMSLTFSLLFFSLQANFETDAEATFVLNVGRLSTGLKYGVKGGAT